MIFSRMIVRQAFRHQALRLLSNRAFVILAEQIVQRLGHQFLAALFLFDLEQRPLLVDFGAEGAGNIARINAAWGNVSGSCFFLSLRDCTF